MRLTTSTTPSRSASPKRFQLPLLPTVHATAFYRPSRGGEAHFTALTRPHSQCRLKVRRYRELITHCVCTRQRQRRGVLSRATTLFLLRKSVHARAQGSLPWPEKPFVAGPRACRRIAVPWLTHLYRASIDTLCNTWTSRVFGSVSSCAQSFAKVRTNIP